MQHSLYITPIRGGTKYKLLRVGQPVDKTLFVGSKLACEMELKRINDLRIIKNN